MEGPKMCLSSVFISFLIIYQSQGIRHVRSSPGTLSDYENLSAGTEHTVSKRSTDIAYTKIWNSTTHTYTVRLDWSYNSNIDVSQITNRVLIYIEKYGEHEVLGSRRDILLPSGSSNTYEDVHIIPLNYSNISQYELYTVITGMPQDIKKVHMTLYPPVPNPPSNFKLVSYNANITNYDVSDETSSGDNSTHFLLLSDLELSFTPPSPVVSDSLNYQIWIGYENSTVPTDNIYNITEINSSNMTLITAILTTPVSLTLPSNSDNLLSLFIKVRCSYRVLTRFGNITVHSNWANSFNTTLSLVDQPANTDNEIEPTRYITTSSGNVQYITTSSGNVQYITTSSGNVQYTTSSNTVSSSDIPLITSTRATTMATTTTTTSVTINPSTSISTNDEHTTTSITTSMLLLPTVAGVGTNDSSIVAVLVVSVVVTLFLLIAIILISLCVLALRRNKRKFKAISDYLDSDNNNDMIAIFHANKQPSIVLSQKSDAILDQGFSLVDKWEIPADVIECDHPLGEGCFGEVYLGRLREDFSNPAWTSYLRQHQGRPFVAIKLLKSSATSTEKNDFLKEIELMKKISSGHNTRVVNMIGAVTIQEPMMLVTEFVVHGDLLNYLRACRKKMYHNKGSVYHRMKMGMSFDNDEGGSSEETLSKEKENVTDELGEVDAFDLISFAYQITSGMEYLSSLQVVHRDLACRNILVGEGKSLKITDFGLSRMIYNDSMYVKTTKGKLPIKWMSIESIVDRVFTSSSDVWSFGVTLWEIATLGATPYPTVGNEELLQKLLGGYRMSKPYSCSDEIYTIMLECWQEVPEDRPTFVNLRKQFDALLSKQGNLTNHYMDLSVLDNSAHTLEDSKPASNPAPNNEQDSNIMTSSSFTDQENYYVDSPTHKNERPNCLSIPSSRSRLHTVSVTSPGGPLASVSPGGISLPPGGDGLLGGGKKYSSSCTNESGSFFKVGSPGKAIKF